MQNRASTLGQLKASGYRSRSVKDELRQSETGRRAVVLCPTEWTCEAPITVLADGPVRLR